MTNVPLLNEVATWPLGTIAAQPAQTLIVLKAEAADRLRAAKACVDRLDRATLIKYADRALSARRAAGKDTGMVHFDDDGIRVSVDQPKRVEWDQARLGAMVARIQAQGEDPSEFVETIYHIAESRYNAWPSSLRESFEPARHLKPGKASIRLALPEVPA